MFEKFIKNLTENRDATKPVTPSGAYDSSGFYMIFSLFSGPSGVSALQRRPCVSKVVFYHLPLCISVRTVKKLCQKESGVGQQQMLQVCNMILYKKGDLARGHHVVSFSFICDSIKEVGVNIP